MSPSDYSYHLNGAGVNPPFQCQGNEITYYDVPGQVAVGACHSDANATSGIVTLLW